MKRTDRAMLVAPPPSQWFSFSGGVHLLCRDFWVTLGDGTGNIWWFEARDDAQTSGTLNVSNA